MAGPIQAAISGAITAASAAAVAGKKLSEEEKSMRDLNNLILSTLAETEYQLLANEGKVKQLILTPEIITDPKKISLK